jgi:hypothetical protein
MGRGSFVIITPERVADHLERLIDDPAELREQLEANVRARLEESEINARFGAVLFRRVRDKHLYEPSGWPTWRDFCAFFSPQEPERIDVLIRALEVLESRGEKRDFGEPEAREIVLRDKPGRPRNDERNAGNHQHYSRAEHNTVRHIEDRLRREDPDLAERVERGELTAHAAAVEKGWRKPRTPYGDMVSGWRRASDHDRMRFEDFIEQWHREDEEVA